MIITLVGFGTFDEDEASFDSMVELAKKHSVEFYPTYYDHELKGDADAIEKVTMELWSMPRDQWEENALTETII